MFYIYKLTCKKNKKIYIGITENIKRRMTVHWNSKENTVLARTIRKYGRDIFELNIIEKVKTWDKACEREKYYIKIFNTKIPYGMNMTNGGEGLYGFRHSEKTRRKMSNSHKGKGVGKDNPMYGKVGINKNKKFSKETKRKISETKKRLYKQGLIIPWNKGKKGLNTPWNKGKKGVYSKETLEKMSKANKGRKWSEETREREIKRRIEQGVYKGEKNPQAKLRNDDIIIIKDLYFNKRMKQKDIGALFNITQSNISYIVRNKTWDYKEVNYGISKINR